MATYGEQCAFCGFSFNCALEAAHIVRWKQASSTERLHPTNGILLCSNHHKLFDEGILTISENFTIKHNDKHKHYSYYTKIDNMSSTNLNGKRIILPSRKKHYPSIAFIKKRNRIHD